ncbi:MAG: tyrosine-type recombinase/integrase [Marinospirillum sp.]|uniref:DUF6538 domain-containing protein n=1 Tax=Marinospirillum sp. TaxID=2183934 RepID=UPI0019EE3911|nr:DUF6538 domain-containing protein [Marinospirillum sp.]MBE0508022.1 tyrosine-type recombinase/integrase [Marinospirillum sp.]
MKYLQRRYNKWYAVLAIPQDVQHEFNGKKLLIKSTGTSDKAQAQTVALALVAEWKGQIAAARAGQQQPNLTPLEMALLTRKQIEEERTSGIVVGGYTPTEGAVVDLVEKLADQGKHEEATIINRVALSGAIMLEAELPEWEATLHHKPRTVMQMKRNIQEVVAYFPTVADVTPQRVREWAKAMVMPESEGGRGMMKATIENRFKAARSLWRHLQEVGKAPADSDPFKLPRFVNMAEKRAREERAKETGSPDKYVLLTVDESVTLLRAAEAKGDKTLRDLILLGMFTGARIEELCKLRTKHCTSDILRIADSKTAAGLRDVPVHPVLKPAVERMIQESTDGYLLSGLTTTALGERSSAIGKRFGRLKKKLGFPESKVFHSHRKTVITTLENAGVLENLAADIVGHEKPRITFGVYSGGASLEVKSEAIKHLKYPL